MGIEISFLKIQFNMLCAYKTLLSSKSIVLASASERRKDILNILGFAYEVVPSPFNEDQNRPDTNDPQEFTKWTASQKALAIVEQLKHTRKPTSAKNAVDMLKTLSWQYSQCSDRTEYIL